MRKCRQSKQIQLQRRKFTKINTNIENHIFVSKKAVVVSTPAAFKTNRALQLMKSTADTSGITIEEVEKKAVANLPMGRYQTTDEFGNLVAFLASDLAMSITGTTIQRDGAISNSLL